MNRLIIAFLIGIVLVAGCGKKEAVSPKKASDENTFVIGLIPEQHIFHQLERYEPLANYLAKKVGMRIRLHVLPRYGNLIDNFVSAGMDGAFFGSFTYAMAHSKLGVEVLARPENLDGVSTYHGLIFVRRDSGIRTAEGMKGKRFAFVDKATTAGYLLPMEYFKENGIKNYKSYLKEAYFTGTHEDAINDVLNRKADIGAAKNTVYDRMAKDEARINKELVILKKSPDVPENGLAVKKDLDGTIKKRLKEALLTMHEDPEGKEVLKRFGARRFIETTDKNYEPVFKYAQEIGLNLSTYDYMNE